MDISIAWLCASMACGLIAVGDDSPAPTAAPAAPATSAPASGEPAAPANTPATPAGETAAAPAGVATTEIRVQPKVVADAAKPERDPTLISVPSNTLGPGEPLWVRREREQAAARIAVASASYAEARAALARAEAQRAASGDDDGAYGGVVIYGPHRPGLHRAVLARPRPRIFAPAPAAAPPADDLHAQAQREFFEASYPRLGPVVEPSLEAQRTFGRLATPPVIQPQRDRDDAVIRARKVTRPPE